jgi:hypothetical protein
MKNRSIKYSFLGQYLLFGYLGATMALLSPIAAFAQVGVTNIVGDANRNHIIGGGVSGFSISPEPFHILLDRDKNIPSIASSVGHISAGSIGGGQINIDKIFIPSIIGPRANIFRVPETFSNNFNYNRFSKNSGPSGLVVPARVQPASTKKIYREVYEKVEKVESIIPGIGGYETVSGYNYTPDFSKESWVWLPFGQR